MEYRTGDKPGTRLVEMKTFGSGFTSSGFSFEEVEIGFDEVSLRAYNTRGMQTLEDTSVPVLELSQEMLKLH